MVRRPGRRPVPADPGPGRARAALLRLLGRRDYTTQELRARLLARGHASDEIERALAGLHGEGLVDDLRVARTHVRTAAAVKGRGRRRIQLELERRGVDRDTARSAVDELSAEDERAAIVRVVSRRAGGVPADRPGRQRLFQQLRRRGFSSHDIAAVLDDDALRSTDDD